MNQTTNLSLEYRTSGKRFGYRTLVALTDTLLLILVFWSVIPETVFDDRVRLAGIPLSFLIWYAIVACASLECLLSDTRSRKGDICLMGSVSLLALMAVVGAWNHVEFRWWVIDTTHFSGLVVGLYWGSERYLSSSVTQMIRLGILSFFVLAVTVLGLGTGFIMPASTGRMYTYGLFTASLLVATTIPLWITNARYRYFASQISAGWIFLLGAGAGTILFVVAVYSATKSVLFLSCCTLLVTCWVTLKRSDGFLYYLAILILSLLTLMALLLDRSTILANTQISERIASHNLEEEMRYIELEMMFAQVNGAENWLIGNGFGTRFESCITVDGENLAIAPHVAVLTLLYKGGLLAFTTVIVIPTVQSVYRLLFRRGSRLQLAFMAGALLYIISSSMSGGWAFLSLFVYGAFWSMSNQSTRIKESVA